MKYSPDEAMHWIAPSEKDADIAACISSLSASQGERAGVRCWSSDAAEQAVPASHVARSEYNVARPEGLLGLIFLRFAEARFAAQRAKLLKQAEAARPLRRSLGEDGRLDEPATYHAEGILYLPPRRGSIPCSTAPKPKTSAHCITRHIYHALQLLGDGAESDRAMKHLVDSTNFWQDRQGKHLGILGYHYQITESIDAWDDIRPYLQTLRLAVENHRA